MFITPFSPRFEGTNPYSRAAHEKSRQRKQESSYNKVDREVSSVVVAVSKDTSEILRIMENNFEKFSDTGNQKTKLLIINYYKKMEDTCKPLGISVDTELYDDDEFKKTILSNLKEAERIKKLTDIV